jgi:hypothetical protein
MRSAAATGPISKSVPRKQPFTAKKSLFMNSVEVGIDFVLCCVVFRNKLFRHRINNYEPLKENVSWKLW